MKRILDIILNPYSLSLWVLLIILFIFPIRIDKYASELTGQGEYLNDFEIFYDDLDGDGNSERIAFFHNSMGAAAVTVSNSAGILDQWTFKGRFDFSRIKGTLITGDSDANGISEIYAFTLKGDSILLSIIPDFRNKERDSEYYFVSLVGLRENKADPYIVEAELDDLNSDGIGELIFGIGTGYSRFPRRIFAFDPSADSFSMSVQTGYFFNNIIQADIDGDGANEIIPGGYAAYNIHDGTDYPDTSSWLMVLNNELSFEFPPVPFPGVYSNLKPAVISGENGKHLLTALYIPPEKLGQSNRIFVFDSIGNTVKSIDVDQTAIEVGSLKTMDGKLQLLLGIMGKGISLLDTSLNVVSEYNYDFNGHIISCDIDDDGYSEIINTNLLSRQITILRNDLKHPVILNIDGKGEKGIICSLVKRAGTTTELYFQLGSNYSLFRYGINPVYRFRWFLYAAVYLSILLFTLIVRKIQRDQIRRKNETNRKITDLQLQIVRNQLDPHFIMNAVNSIIDGLNENEKDDVKKQLLHFSQLHRSLILTSDQIKRSLHEEIDFTRNYLALEKFRFRDKFSYEFDIDSAVDMNWEVPKMIVQIHVENALKHGIFHREYPGGIVLVKVSGDDSRILIEITDNGVGREFARTRKSNSTGRGTQLMQQYSDLINKSFTDRINILTEDLYKENGDSAGTKVTIEITF